jgi:Cdc6-like AAA superfamily ATPase
MGELEMRLAKGRRASHVLLSEREVVLRKRTAPRPPESSEDWASLRAEVLDLFTPGAPIDEVSLFAGRQSHIQRLRDTVVSRGRHAIVFGERGTGKTSLVNIFHLGWKDPRDVCFVYVQCAQADTFQSVWRKALRRVAFGESLANDLVVGEITADELEVVLANFGPSTIPIIVFDEFDRPKDENIRALMSETIKQLSNSPTVHATIVLVGVASNITQLMRQHASAVRALVQIRMPRMDSDEIKDIVQSRLRVTPINITGDALWRVTYLSSGLPFCAHAIGQAASLVYAEKRTLHISEEIVRQSIESCFKDVDQELIDSYVKATVETRKGNLFSEVLAAAALAEQDELGRFSAADVEAPLSSILDSPMKSSSFTFHLNELCEPQRGAVLEREGTRGKYRYKFVQPIIQPFIIMKSLTLGVVSDPILSKYAIQRQRVLSI